jgi:FMN phosphatase YigB (HAD superfamily)
MLVVDRNTSKDTSLSKNNAFESSKGKKGKKAVIFDLDGTLADTVDPNGHHKENHEGFRQHIRGADANQDMVDKVRKANEKGRDVVILTARSAHYRDTTKKWLNEKGIQYDSLLMRHIDDHRKDKIVKKDLLENDVLPNFKVKKAYDDKNKNVKMFRSEGIEAKRVK